MNPIGSSSCQTRLGSSSKNCFGVITISWWSVPNALLTSRAYSNSFASRSRKPTENVLIGSSTIVDIIAAIALESIPPDRNMPNGTSAIRRISTDFRKRSRHSSTYSASLRGSCFGSKLRSQNSRISSFPSFHTIVWPGISRWIPRYKVSSPDVP